MGKINVLGSYKASLLIYLFAYIRSFLNSTDLGNHIHKPVKIENLMH